MEDNSIFSSTNLYGDDFTTEEIMRWYKDETESFTDLYVRDQDYKYGTHALDEFHLFSYLPPHTWDNVLGFGSAGGDEFKPILEKINSIVIVEPSSLYNDRVSIENVPAKWILPSSVGDLPFSNNTFDLITCLSVLHHIPNVSFITKEIARVLRPGGYLLIREPVISLGDWRKPRAMLTKNERGIPLPFLYNLFLSNQLIIKYQSRCIFPPVHIILNKLKLYPYNSELIVKFDYLLSKMFSWNYHYHRTKWWQKISPRTACFVLVKQ